MLASPRFQPRSRSPRVRCVGGPRPGSHTPRRKRCWPMRRPFDNDDTFALSPVDDRDRHRPWARLGGVRVRRRWYRTEGSRLVVTEWSRTRTAGGLVPLGEGARRDVGQGGGGRGRARHHHGWVEGAPPTVRRSSAPPPRSSRRRRERGTPWWEHTASDGVGPVLPLSEEDVRSSRPALSVAPLRCPRRMGRPGGSPPSPASRASRTDRGTTGSTAHSVLARPPRARIRDAPHPRERNRRSLTNA